MNTLSHSIGKTEDPEVAGKVSMLRSVLRPFGYADLLEGLPEDADDRVLMGRLVEIGPSLGDGGAKQVSSEELQALVAASRFVGESHRDTLLSRVRAHAYDSASPHQIMAHEALAPVDAASSALLTARKREQIQQLRSQATGKVHGCCGGHEF